MLLEGKYHLLQGEEVDLSRYQGNVVLVVNTASHCGFTPTYKTLEDLWQEYRSRGLVVLGFPSGSFGEQEFDSSEEIGSFCQQNYGVSFPLFEKSDVLEENPLFLQLAEQSEAPGWNFTKYLIGRDGQLLKHFPSAENDLAEEIEAALGVF